MGKNVVNVDKDSDGQPISGLKRRKKKTTVSKPKPLTLLQVKQETIEEHQTREEEKEKKRSCDIKATSKLEKERDAKIAGGSRA